MGKLPEYTILHPEAIRKQSVATRNRDAILCRVSEKKLDVGKEEKNGKWIRKLPDGRDTVGKIFYARRHTG